MLHILPKDTFSCEKRIGLALKLTHASISFFSFQVHNLPSQEALHHPLFLYFASNQIYTYYDSLKIMGMNRTMGLVPYNRQYLYNTP